ncbi:MAG: hypothetical protein Q8P59_13280, partial [Dehalococcoidia bacterium]|nr:hypothetical protein [Dehalococcoidia bacterium]
MTTPLVGITAPNRQWSAWTKREENALLDIRPQALLFLGYPDSPALGDQLEQQARVWEALGKPRVLLRPYAEKIMLDYKPKEWAMKCFVLLRRYASYGIQAELVPWNEANLEGMGEYWASQTIFATVFADAFLDLSPDTLLHHPALSPQRKYRDGWRYFVETFLGEWYQEWNVHAYNEAQLQDAAILHGICGKPICVTEVNQMHPSFYHPKLASLGCVTAHFWFILSGEVGGGQDQQPYWLRGSPFYDDFKELSQGIVLPEPLPGSQPQAGGLNDDDEGGDMAQYVLGFKDLAERLGASVVGEPEMDEASIVIEVDMV